MPTKWLTFSTLKRILIGEYTPFMETHVLSSKLRGSLRNTGKQRSGNLCFNSQGSNNHAKPEKCTPINLDKVFHRQMAFSSCCLGSKPLTHPLAHFCMADQGPLFLALQLHLYHCHPPPPHPPLNYLHPQHPMW